MPAAVLRYCSVIDPDMVATISDTTVVWVHKQSQRLVAHSELRAVEK